MKKYHYIAFLFFLLLAFSCKSKQQTAAPAYEIGIGGSIIGFQEQPLEHRQHAQSISITAKPL